MNRKILELMIRVAQFLIVSSAIIAILFFVCGSDLMMSIDGRMIVITACVSFGALFDIATMEFFDELLDSKKGASHE